MSSRSIKPVRKNEEEDSFDTDVMSDEDNFIDDERIVKKRKRNGEVQYYVKWKDCADESNFWEPIKNLDSEMIKEFEKQRKLKNANEKKKTMNTRSNQLGNKYSTSSSSSTSITEKKMKNRSSQLGKNIKKSSSSGSPPPQPSSSSPSSSPSPSFTSMTESMTSLATKLSVYQHKVMAQEEEVKIIGVIYKNCEMHFTMRFGGPQPSTEHVPFEIANIKWPQIVTKYYEERLVNRDLSIV